MKIARLAYGVAGIVWVGACAPRAPEASAPAPGPIETRYAPPPADGVPAPVGPPPAAAAPGLRDEAATRPQSADDKPDFSTLDAAERALNQAKADLDRLALAEPAPMVGRSTASSAAAEKKERSAAPAPKASAAANSAPSALCENACRAFSSLTRAANAVCRLDGDGGTHCTRAKRVVADSQIRVSNCSCPVE